MGLERHCRLPVDSVIISDFPKIFIEFRGKRFSRLWRGGRDGFDGRNFHDHCGGHVPTLTFIQYTKGNVFGGFTLVAWASMGGWAEDGSLRSFVFTLVDPHGMPPRKFQLIPSEQKRAIDCSRTVGPTFSSDVTVPGSCDRRSSTELGRSSANDTGPSGTLVFTGSPDFDVNKVEVFAIR
jgi:hypothetical protein